MHDAMCDPTAPERTRREQIQKKREDRERAHDLKRELNGLNLALAAIHRERDRIKHEIHEVDPFCSQGRQENTVGACRNCDEPICSECNPSCPNPNCEDTNPHDYDYGPEGRY